MHLLDLFAEEVSGDADDAVSSNAQHRQRNVVISAIDEKIVTGLAYDFCNLREIGICLFQRGNVFNFGQTDDRIGFQIDACPFGNVVQHDRQGGVFSDGSEMLIQPFLRRAVVIRSDKQDPVNADRFCPLVNSIE